MLLSEIFRQLIPESTKVVGTIVAIHSNGYRVELPDGGLMSATGQTALNISDVVIVEDGLVIAVLGNGISIQSATIF